MKIKLLLSAFAIAIATMTFAQTEKTAMPSDEALKEEAMKLTEDMTSYLKLSETQVERIKGMNMTLVKKRAELKSMGLTDEQVAERVKAYEDRHTATAKEVLDAEQYEKFKSKYMMTKDSKKVKAKN